MRFRCRYDYKPLRKAFGLSSGSNNIKRVLPSSASSCINIGQMFVTKPTVLFTIAAVITLMFFVVVNDNRVDAGLIHIYHKYRPKLLSSSAGTEEPLNASSSAHFQQIEDPSAVAAADDAASLAANIEYTSPMKRIMELISQHTPVIVVSSDATGSGSNSNQIQDQQQQQHHQQHQHQTQPQQIHFQPDVDRSMAALVQSVGSPSAQQLANQLQQPSSLNAAALASNNQQWTLLDASQVMQPILAAQQQQFIQTALPYEQYYMPSPGVNQFGEEMQQQQYTVHLPGSLGFSPATSYQQLATLPYSNMPTAEAQPQQAMYQAQQQHQHQQQHQMLQQSQQHQQLQPLAPQQSPKTGQEDRAQPVFLSSYVPEISSKQATIPHTSNSPVPQVAPEPRPNSIQQIQQSQSQKALPAANQARPVQPQAAPVANKSQSGGGGQDSAGDSGDTSDELDSPASDDSGGSKTSVVDEQDYPDNSDLEEPTKYRRSNNDKSPHKASASEPKGEDNQEGQTGSMSYEDKYDSDKEEPRQVSLSIKNPKAEQSNTVVNGLVNVGLNDDCLQCICRASSGCDHLLRCITRGSEEKYCGPFQLTEEYWNLAGSPGDASNNFLSFEDCANDPDCAVETVTNYMKKYHKDCDGDENITCMDYARLHKLKPTECGNTDKLVVGHDAYWAKFQRCAEGYNRSRNGDDEDI